MKAERASEACPKFAEAHRLDPSAIGVVLNLAECSEQVGNTASAWAAFNEAASMARKSNEEGRAEEAARRAKALEPKLARITVLVRPANRLPGLEVRWDRKPVGEGGWGTPVPVDPGEHVIEASAPGRKSWSGTVRVTAAGTATAEVPLLEEAPKDEIGATPSGPAASFWQPRRIGGAVAAGVGLVGIVVGSAIGARAASDNTASKGYCRPSDPNLCRDPGVKLRESAYTEAHISTASFVIGGAALLSGVLLFAIPSNKPPASTGQSVEARPFVGVGTGGLILSGEW